MTQDIFSDSINAIREESFSSNDSENIKIISVRPGNKISALLDVMTEMNQNKLPLEKISNLISRELAFFVISRKSHADILEKVVKDRISLDSGSALDLLSQENILKHNLPIEFNF